MKYVVELARTLAHHPMVYRVDLLTRLITNDAVDSDYGVHEERISEPNYEEPLQGAFIVRLKAGNPDVYIAKEALWPHVRECVRSSVACMYHSCYICHVSSALTDSSAQVAHRMYLYLDLDLDLYLCSREQRRLSFLCDGEF